MKSLVVLLLLQIGLPISVYGQSPKIDSLEQLIQKATTDTAKINLTIKQLKYLSEYNIDTAITVSKKTIEAAEKIHYKKGEANARLKLANNYCFKGEYSAASENLKIAEKLFLSLQDSAGLGSLYSSSGMMYGMQSKYDSAVKYYESTIQIARYMHNDALLYSAYQNIAISYQMQSNFTQALSYLQKSVDYYEKTNNENAQSYVTLTMGLIYNSMGDVTRAERSLIKSLTLSKAAGTRNVELYVYTNLASVYENKKNYKDSYKFAMEAARLGKEMGDLGIEAASLAKVATSLAHLNRLDEAEKIAQQSIRTAIASKQPFNTFQAYDAMGNVLKMQKKYDAAIIQFEKAFNMIQESDIYDEYVGKTYSNVSECYSKTGNYKQALSAYKVFAEISDSVRSRENISKATELNMNYEFEKKQQIANAAQEKKNTETRTRQLVLSVGLLLTLIIALIAFYAFRTKQQANTLLQYQKEEIETTLSELKSTQEQLIQREKMASLGELTAGIAHEIQNPLNFVNNFSEVSEELVEELKSEAKAGNQQEVLALADDLIQNLEKISHHGKRADSIVKGMLQHSKGTSGEKRLTDINALIEEYLRLCYHGLRTKEKDFNAHFKLEADPAVGKIEVVPQEIGRVMLNLFNNAFYATQQKKARLNGQYQPQVTVTTKRVGNKVEIRVKDNGIGIPENVRHKIFQPFFTTKPTGEGTGLGLSLSYDIITKGHGGELKVEGREGEYSEFIILLPKS